MMLAPSDEQSSIAESVREFLSAELPIDRVRALHSENRALDWTTWKRCAELGWLGLSVPEEYGGMGLGLAEEVMLLRELGRGLAPGPFLGTALAAVTCAKAGEAGIARQLVEGERSAGLILGEYGLDLHAGDLGIAIDGDGARLVEVTADSSIESSDPGVRLARIDAAAVASVTDPTLVSRLRVMIAAQLLGVIEAVRDMSASYASTREQFGRPIGVFQAVKHRCADMAIAAYAVQAQVFFAAVHVQAGYDDAAFHAAAAHRLAIASAKRSAEDNIQNHGGIGYTWEHDAHLYLKRARTLEHAAGSRQSAHETLMAPVRHEFR